MSRALGLETTDFEAFDAAICQMLDRLDIPSSLSDIGVPVEAAQRIAGKAHQDAAAATNPREADVETIERLVIEAITKGRGLDCVVRPERPMRGDLISALVHCG